MFGVWLVYRFCDNDTVPDGSSEARAARVKAARSSPCIFSADSKIGSKLTALLGSTLPAYKHRVSDYDGLDLLERVHDAGIRSNRAWH